MRSLDQLVSDFRDFHKYEALAQIESRNHSPSIRVYALALSLIGGEGNEKLRGSIGLRLFPDRIKIKRDKYGLPMFGMIPDIVAPHDLFPRLT